MSTPIHYEHTNLVLLDIPRMMLLYMMTLCPYNYILNKKNIFTSEHMSSNNCNMISRIIAHREVDFHTKILIKLYVSPILLKVMHQFFLYT